MANNARISSSLLPRNSSRSWRLFIPRSSKYCRSNMRQIIFFRRRAEGKDISARFEMPSETTQPPSERSVSEHKNSREAFPPQICSRKFPFLFGHLLCVYFSSNFPPFFLLLVFRTHLLNFFFWLMICYVSQDFYFYFFLPSMQKSLTFFRALFYFCF